MQEAPITAQADLGGRAITMHDAILRAASRVEATVGSGRWWRPRTRHVMGRVLSTMGEFSFAEEHLRRSLALCSAALGPDAPDTLYTEFALGEMLNYAERLEEASAIAEPLVARAARCLGDSAMLARSARELLANIRLSQGRLDDAERLVQGLLDDPGPEQGPGPGKWHRILGQIAKWAEASGPSRSSTWRRPSRRPGRRPGRRRHGVHRRRQRPGARCWRRWGGAAGRAPPARGPRLAHRTPQPRARQRPQLRVQPRLDAPGPQEGRRRVPRHRGPARRRRRGRWAPPAPSASAPACSTPGAWPPQARRPSPGPSSWP